MSEDFIYLIFQEDLSVLDHMNIISPCRNKKKKTLTETILHCLDLDSFSPMMKMVAIPVTCRL